MADAKTTELSVVTATGTVADGPVRSVTIPTTDGEITVLPDHVPLVSVIRPGVLTIRTGKDGADEQHLAVSGGFLKVSGDSISVLADTAERADDIDRQRAEQARKRAEQAMAGKLEREELAEAQAELQKHLARLRAVELAGTRRRGRGGRSQTPGS
ncbi:MAG: ATP synthase F1 subunit epsilon [bacterium]|nr:ATP synthase F1 subunit epsilon [bacterium]MDZ4248368.1 ATP synthase F1 subunit epsilon [Patescibacteria group bacterium]